MVRTLFLPNSTNFQIFPYNFILRSHITKQASHKDVWLSKEETIYHTISFIYFSYFVIVCHLLKVLKLHLLSLSKTKRFSVCCRSILYVFESKVRSEKGFMLYWMSDISFFGFILSCLIFTVKRF